MRFKTKLIAIFLIMTTIPIIIVGLVSYSIASSSITDEVIQSTTQLADQVNNSINLYLEKCNKFLKMSENKAVINFYLTEKYDRLKENLTYEEMTHLKFVETLKIIELFKTYRNVFTEEYIKGIYLLGLDGNHICESKGKFKLDKNILMLESVKTILEQDKEISIFPNGANDFFSDKPYNDAFSLGAVIKEPVTHKILGVVIVDISKSSIGEIILASGVNTNDITIITEDTNVLYSTNNDYHCISDIDIEEKNLKKLYSSDKGHFVNNNIDGSSAFFIFNTLQNTNWKIINDINMNELMSGVYSIRSITFIIIICTLMFVVILYFFISGRLTRPLSMLRNNMKEAENGNLDVQAEIRGDGEIAELSISFNKMLCQIKQLIENNNKEHEMIKKLELKAMQAQINPHFLYNSLDAIIWMAQSHNKDGVTKITKALSNFFRISLSKGKEWISLKEELELTENYLKIQKMRYRDIVEYELNIDHNILDSKVLKFTLQPIVENALYHGLKNKRSKGLIRVIGTKKNEKIVLEVIDNGGGMNKERLTEVCQAISGNAPVKSSSKGGFGVKNVYDRIQLYYGNGYGLKITSIEGRGTHVKIYLADEGR